MPLLFSFLQHLFPRPLGAVNEAKDVSQEQTGKCRSLSVFPDWMIRGRKTSYKQLTIVAPFSWQVSIPGMRIPILISWPISHSSLMVSYIWVCYPRTSSRCISCALTPVPISRVAAADRIASVAISALWASLYGIDAVRRK